MKAGRIILGALAAALFPAVLSAQYVSDTHRPLSERFTLEPYAGLYFDNVRAGGAVNTDQSGWLGGLRLGLILADRSRIVGDVGYSRVGEVGRIGAGENAAVIGSETWLATGGLELDVVPGLTSGSLGLQYGAAWRSEALREVVGSPTPVEIETGWTRSQVLVPSFSIRHRVTPRADLRLGVQDYIFFDNDPVSHNFAVSAGITLR